MEVDTVGSSADHGINNDKVRKIRLEHIKEAVIPAGLTLLVFLFILALKGIWPFGSLGIDYYDMGQTNAPLYYHLWDFLHGKGGLFWSWYIDEGQNLSMASSIQWNISVYNLFFLFIKRETVFRSLSLFTGLRLFFMAFNMDLFLNRTTPARKMYRILLSLCYGLTGYTLTHYTITTYLDMAALMPLYLMTLYGVLTCGNDIKVNIKQTLIYTLMTGYMTALGYYMAFMNLIFILLTAASFIFILMDKKDRGAAALRLGAGTFGGMGLASFMLIPAALQMTHSSRFNSNLSGGLFTTLHEILWSIGADMYYIKWWLLSGSIAAIVIIIYGMILDRSNRRRVVFFFLYCMYPCALIIFESINLLWHMGQYYHYPIRCGYLIPIVLLSTAAYYSERLKEGEIKTGGIAAMVVIGLFSAALGAGLIRYYIRHDVFEITELFRTWVIFATILAFIYVILIILVKNPAFAIPVIVMELVVCAYAGYGQPHFHDRFSSDPEQSGEYITVSLSLMDGMDIPESRTERIKNPDTTLNTNYGFIMRRATVGGWANTVPRDQMESAMGLGYGAHFMRILDSGGTLLSDAALHVTQTITMEPSLYTEEICEKRDEAEGYTLLDNRFKMPYVMLTNAEEDGSDDAGADPDANPGALEADGDVLTSKSEEEGDATEDQVDILTPTRGLYHKLSYGRGLSGSAEEFFTPISEGSGEVENVDKHTLRYYVNGKKALYYKGEGFESMTVNGEVIPVPDIGDPKGRRYPGWFNENLLFTGVYGNESLEIRVDENSTIDAKSLYEMDLDMLDDLCADLKNDHEEDVTASKNSVDIIVDSDDRYMALIPMAYDEGLRASVNGKEVDIKNYRDMFIELPIEPGDNRIHISFVPKGLVPGMISTIFFVMLTAFFCIRPLKKGDILKAVCEKILLILFLLFFTGLYLIPYGAFIIHQIEKRI